jgi:hypothetical protein
MNNTTELNKNATESYYSLEYWLKVFGSIYALDVVNVALIPIGIIGAVLNILALIVMRAENFNLPFYTYLRAYTYCSICICLLNATLFTTGTRYLLKFTNTKGSVQYYSYFFGPLITIINLYGSFIDVVLSMERIVLLSKKLEWFKKIDPKLLCVIFAIITNLFTWPYWTIYEPEQSTVMLNETTPFIIHYANFKSFSSGLIKYLIILPYIIDTFPIVLETAFNIISIFLIKKYTKNKIRVLDKSRADRVTKTAVTVHNINTIGRSVPNTNSPSTTRARRMEVKLTILVIFLSILSTLYVLI